MKVAITGEIGGWGVTASDLNWQLSDVPPSTPLEVEIHSGGGDVFEGLAIYSALQSFDDVTVEVTGIAASMAAVIMAAASPGKLTARAHAMIMIHAPSMYSYGGKKDKEQDAKLLEQIEAQTASIMAGRMGMSVDDFVAKFYDGYDHWLTASEAKAIGLIDELTYDFEAEDQELYEGLPAASANQVNNLIRNSINNLDTMTKQEYESKLAEQAALIEQLTEKVDALEASAAEADVKYSTDITASKEQTKTLIAALAQAKGMSELEQKLVAKSQDAETIQMVLDAEPIKVAPTSQARAMLNKVAGTATDSRLEMSYAELSKKHPQFLAELKQSNPELFESKLREYTQRNK